MEIGLVEKVDIDNEMQQAYLDYAMSVIVARALPDARDGLKPVHRRILYAMYDMGLRPETSYKKSARIVGEVLGKYHPHGDMAVYEAMARMAQDFSMRNLLVDGQGNFGSVDGDSPAAMRYTEARLTSSAMRMLADIQKETVNFSPNFDGSLTEPDVLPAALPNLLVNGATGIAVGMSTSIPPHNLGEVVDALKFMLENWSKLDDLSVEDLMRFIKGPDFPTGGVIIQDQEGDGLHSSYGSGRGRVTVQARVRLEEMERGRSRLIVTELPYMTNKSSLIERIAELVREERLEGIADLRDESDRQGMRIVIELNKAADPEKVLRDLYRHTPMQSTFSIILLALVDGEPRLLSLKQALRVYLDHRLEIVRRRSQYDLEKARQRAHILEGLRIALQHLDEVIDLIRKAPDAETARERLIKRFKLTEIQAQAILDLQLRRLASLERKKIELEYKEVLALIKELEALLRSPVKMRGVIADELQAVKDAFGDRRRTQIVLMKEGESKLSLLTATDLTPEKTVWLSVTPQGLISRTIDEALPRLSGGDAPAWLVQANTRDVLYLVTERGEAAAVAVHSLPEVENPSVGVPVWKVSALHEGDVLAGLFPLPPKGERPEDWFMLVCTRQGMVKKSPVNDLPGPSASTFTVVKVNEGDRLGWLRLTHGSAEVLLATAGGMVIRFSEDEVRPMGLVASGVMGIKFQNGDEVAGMDVLPQPGDIFLLASNGGAKRVPVKDFPRQGRYGQGVTAWKLPDGIRVVGLAVGKGTARAILHLEKLAPKSIRLDAAPLQSRGTRGQVISEVKGDRVLKLVLPWYTPRPVSGGTLVGSGGNGGDDQGGKKQGSGDKERRSGAGEQGSEGTTPRGDKVPRRSQTSREPVAKRDDKSEPGTAKKKSAAGTSRQVKTQAAGVKSRASQASGPAGDAPSAKGSRASKTAASSRPAAAGKAAPASKPPAASKKAAASATGQLPLDLTTTAAAGVAAAKTGAGTKTSRATKTTSAAAAAPTPAAAKTPVRKTSTAAGAKAPAGLAKSASPAGKAPPAQAGKASPRGKAAAAVDAGRTSKTRTKAADAAAVTAVSGSPGRRKTAADAKTPAVGKAAPQGKAPTGKKVSAAKAAPAATKSSAAAGRFTGSAADPGAKPKGSRKDVPAQPAPKASSKAKTTSATAAKPSPAPAGSKGSTKAAASKKSAPVTSSKAKATSPAAAKGAAPPKASQKKPSTGKTGSPPKTSPTTAATKKR